MHASATHSTHGVTLQNLISAASPHGHLLYHALIVYKYYIYAALVWLLLLRVSGRKACLMEPALPSSLMHC